MADSTNPQYLRGDDFEAILDVLEDTEGVEEQFAVIVRNVSCKNGNFESKFRSSVLKFAMHPVCMICSIRVIKRNPTNARANIKLIYRFPSMKISSRTLLNQGILI